MSKKDSGYGFISLFICGIVYFLVEKILSNKFVLYAITQTFISLLTTCLVVLILLGFIYLEKRKSKLNGIFNSIWNFLHSISFFNALSKVSAIAIRPTIILKRHKQKQYKAIGAILVSIGLLISEYPISNFFKLPPAEKTAATCIYQTEQKLDGNSILSYVLAQLDLDLSSTSPIIYRSSNDDEKLNTIKGLFYERLIANAKQDFIIESITPGLSRLQLLLGQKNVKNSHDIEQLIKDAPDEIKIAFYETVSGNDKSSWILYYLDESVLILSWLFLGIIFGLFNYRNKVLFWRSISGIAYMYTSVYLLYMINFSMSSLVADTLFSVYFTSSLVIVIWLEVWLSIFLPRFLELKRGITLLVGNIAFFSIYTLTGFIFYDINDLKIAFGW